MHACRGKHIAYRLFAAMPHAHRHQSKTTLGNRSKSLHSGNTQVNRPLCKASLLFEGLKILLKINPNQIR